VGLCKKRRGSAKKNRKQAQLSLFLISVSRTGAGEFEEAARGVMMDFFRGYAREADRGSAKAAAGFAKRAGLRLVMSVLILVILGAIGLLSSGGELLEEPTPEVGQVDLEKILEESLPGQEYQAELDEAGREMKQQYDSAGGSLSETPEQEEIYQRYLRQKERLENNFQAKLESVLAELAEEKGLKTVLTAEMVYSGALDVTAETVKRLDELVELSALEPVGSARQEPGSTKQEAENSGQEN